MSIVYASGVSSEELVFLTNINAEWIQYYFDNYVANDYMVHHCSNQKKSLSGGITLWEQGSIPYQLDQRNLSMLGDLRDLGYSHHMVTPLHDPDSGRIGGLNLVFEDKDFSLIAAKTDYIRMSVFAFHETLKRHLVTTGSEVFRLSNKDLLTQKETDVIRYLSEGLRADRIAERMGLQTVTINMHIQKAKRRLKASTREQLVAKAIASRKIIL